MQQQPNYQQGPPPQQPPADNGKLIAILSYCTLIGFIVAIVMHSSNKTRLGAYHLRQALGLVIFAIGSYVAFLILGFIIWPLFFLAPLVSLFSLVLVILGIINAANEQEKPLLLIGGLSDKIFANAFK
jgi:uncharacterized membrane protein